MWLLNTTTLKFGEFFDTQIPPYAILSHRWGENEVSYQEMRKGRAPEGPGLTKIRSCCKLASTEGYEWVWIDTCCINKKSSAELSEAVNSMFKWYGNARVCYAHLSDVRSGHPDFDVMFSSSSWFTRGWTLQELLAPYRIVFYDFEWTIIGDMDTLCHRISAITRIDADFLTKRKDCSRPFKDGGPSVAERMSWAARRVTSRSEDMAYCLLGLFDVNMPLLYGEGAEKAFLWLQKEIINQEHDESIFAWTADLTVSGLLATSPSFFAESGDIVPRISTHVDHPRFWMTNRGLALDITNRECSGNNRSWIVIDLACRYTGQKRHRTVIVALMKGYIRGNTWFRHYSSSLTEIDLGGYSPVSNKPSSVIYIPQISPVPLNSYDHRAYSASEKQPALSRSVNLGTKIAGHTSSSDFASPTAMNSGPSTTSYKAEHLNAREGGRTAANPISMCDLLLLNQLRKYMNRLARVETCMNSKKRRSRNKTQNCKV
ncbi:MAG: hypothetical protein Q9201_006121 [Fulgogasparrea decipioides]